MMSPSAKGIPGRIARLPLNQDDLTADWLTSALSSDYPGVVAESITVTEFIPGHTTKIRVAVTLNAAGHAAGIPEQLCLKGNWTGNPMSSEACVNEARFYRELAPRLPLPAPVCFHSDWDDDEDGQQGILVLEDMVLRGGQFDTSANAITVNEMARSLEGMADLHGSSWNHPELERQSWLLTAMAPETVGDDYWSMMESYFARHNAIPERVEIFPRWMAENPERLRMAWRQLCTHDQTSTAPRCLVHGDAHLGNSYGLPDAGRLWFDWQIVRKGRPWRDYSYFLIGSISIEDRRAAERDLLRHYLDHLARYGVTIDFDEAFAEYSRWVVWGLVAWQSNINPKEKTMPALERFCRAADDLRMEQYYSF